MDTRRLISISAALLFSGAASFGQNINPTVEVTNIYQGNPSEIQKPQMVMNIPDSLLRFDLDFDYEVFDKPYEGAYNFKPYMLNMKPGKDAFRGRSLYLKAGAGYSLHPQLEFVLSPEQKGPFQMSVYASHKSYFGDYAPVAPKMEDGIWKLKTSDGRFFGYDAVTAAGFDGRYNWDSAELSFGIGYFGIASKDTLVRRSYNGLDFNLRVRSNNDRESYFFYDAGLDGIIARDNLNYSTSFTKPAIKAGKTYLGEGGFVLKGSAGPVFDSSHRLLIGFEGSTSGYSNLFESNIGRLAVIPKYEFEAGRFSLSLGVRIESIVRGEQTDTLNFGAMHRKKGKFIYPDVNVLFTASDNVRIYAKFTGGSNLDTYYSQISSNHHLTPSYSLCDVLMNNSIETFNLALGVRGNIASRLQFDLDGGAASFENGLLDGIYSYVSGTSASFLPSVAYADYDLVYANLLLGWKSRNFALDASLHYRNTSFSDKGGKPVENAFKFPLFSGNLRAVYNITPRFYAGIDADFATVRNGQIASGKVRIPGYVDPGVIAGFSFNRKFGFWAESGNLLGLDVQRVPFYVEKGPWATLGITLSL